MEPLQTSRVVVSENGIHAGTKDQLLPKSDATRDDRKDQREDIELSRLVEDKNIEIHWCFLPARRVFPAAELTQIGVIWIAVKTEQQISDEVGSGFVTEQP